MLPNQPIKDAVQAQGFELVGVAAATGEAESYGRFEDWVQQGFHAGMEYLQTQKEARRSLESVLRGVRSIIVTGKFYSRPKAPTQSGTARIAAYAAHRDYHNVLRKRLKKVVQKLELEHPGHQFRIAVDSAPILEREWALRAGLGWFGKNSCLIDSKRGSLFLIASILTTLEIEPDAPAHGGCGHCTACIDACPTGAILFEDGVGKVDSTRCISYLTIEHKGEWSEENAAQVQDWTFGCDICQAVCPFNHPRANQPLRAPGTEDADFLPVTPAPSLDELLAMTYEEWDRWSAGRPVRRAGFEGIKRNARANLRNLKQAKP